MTYDEKIREKIMSIVTMEPNSGCWLWTKSVDKDGYGVLGYRKKANRAHRVSWTVFKGEIPKGLYVLHKCDVPCCANPDHLYIGTQKDNKRDSVIQGRHLHGEQHHDAKLTADDVLAIREDPRPDLQIAPEYGVSRRAIHSVKARRTWKHL